jgi:hypothetical protein
MPPSDEFDFTSYTIPELERLGKRIGQEIAKKHVSFRRLVPVFELGPARYRNPANSAETWSGRGKQPGWFKLALTRGQQPEDLRN